MSLIGLGSTAVIHWCLKPYVARISLSSDKKIARIDRYDLLGRIRKESFSTDSLVATDERPLVSFKVRGTRNYFFAHVDMAGNDFIVSKMK